MSVSVDLYERLRQQLLGELHIGRLKPGDRLPSVRETARATGADHRLVARVYRALERDCLVEVRPRSGVVVADSARSKQSLEDQELWLAGVLAEAWRRGVRLPDAPGLLARAAASVTCACIESTEDHEVALRSELEGDFGLEVWPVRLGQDGDGPDDDRAVLEHVLAEVPLAVTTAFHAPVVAPIAAALGTPLVIASVNPDLRSRIVAALDRGGVRVVIADPAYAERARAYMRGFEEGVHYTFVLVDDVAAGNATLREGDRALFTRAARRRLGAGEYHLLGGAGPFLSAETAREITAMLVRINGDIASEARLRAFSRGP